MDEGISEAGAPPAKGLGNLGRHSAIYAAGLLFNRLIAFLMLPVYTRYLSPADYGTLQLLGLTMDVVALIAGSRLAGGIFYYFHRAKTLDEKRALLSTALMTLGGAGAAVAIVALVTAESLSVLVFHTPARAMLLRFAAVAFFFDALLLVALTALQVRELSRRYVVATAGKLLLQVLLNLAFLALGWGIEGMMLATAIAGGVVSSWLVVGLARDVGIAFSRSSARDLMRFGLPLIGTQVATMVAAYGDRYVLGAEAGADAVGVYSVAYQFGVLVFSLGFVPFNSIWEPSRFGFAQRPDRDALYAQGFLICNIVLLTLGVGIVVFVGDYLRIATPAAYHAAATLVPMIVLAYVFQAWSDFHNLGIMMRERTEFLTLANWVCAAVAWVGYLTLIPRWGGVGAGFALALAYGVRHAITVSISQRLWHVQYRWGPVLRLFVLAAAVSTIALAAAPLRLAGAIALHTMLFAIYLTGVWYGGILGPEGRALVKNLMRAPRSALASMTGS